MARALRIIIHYDVQRLSPNRRLHWSARHRCNVDAKTAALHGWHAAGRMSVDGPVLVRVLICRARAIDPDNAIACLKPVIDQLFNRTRYGVGITPDDSRAWIRIGSVRQHVATPWKGHERVVLFVHSRKG